MTDIDRLLEVMARLRDPSNGCPWDRQQTFKTIASYTIEEAYEVADAIERGDTSELAQELGDLLFQVVFHAQMARELGLFAFEDVVAHVVDKMIRRHPHVFSDASVDSVEAQSVAWEAHKAAERGAQNGHQETGSLLDDVTRGLPAIKRAVSLQKRAARVRFDWNSPAGVLGKLQEEVREVEGEIGVYTESEAGAVEIGDLMFTCVNLARHLNVDPEAALRTANSKFEQRFRRMERMVLDEGRSLSDCSEEELEHLWLRAKAE